MLSSKVALMWSTLVWVIYESICMLDEMVTGSFGAFLCSESFSRISPPHIAYNIFSQYFHSYESLFMKSWEFWGNRSAAYQAIISLPPLIVSHQVLYKKKCLCKKLQLSVSVMRSTVWWIHIQFFIPFK